MVVRGQGSGEKVLPKCETARRDASGFIMVALLVSMAVTAVWMAAALPSWRHQVRREQEAELIFRGEMIARAIFLYQRKNGTFPPTLDVLVAQKFLRKKYTDPISGKDFLPVLGVAGGAAPGQPAGIIGVRPTSNEQSIRVYNNQQTYSQFDFNFNTEALRSGQGGGAPGAGGPGGARGGPQPGVRPGGGNAPRPGGPGGLGTAPGRGEMNPIVPGRGAQGGVGTAPPPFGMTPPGGTAPGRGR